LAGRVLLKIFYLLTCRVLGVAVLVFRGDRVQAAELLVLRHWSAPGRAFDLRSRADRARVYEIVLQEGRPADILAYVDGALLVDLWDDLVLPRAVRSAWAPLVVPSGEAEG
jgi:hypothetical protein